MCLGFLDFCYLLLYGRPRKNGGGQASRTDSVQTIDAEATTGIVGYLSSSDIKVQCDLFLQQNTKLHHTQEYQNSSLVLRRGSDFDLGMKFEEINFSDLMNVKFRFSMECKHLASKKINIASIGIDDGFNEGSWGVIVVEKDDEKLNIVVRVTIPVSAAIGRYKVEIVLPSYSSFTVLHQFEIIVLFNSWNEADDVYLENEELRQEYVLNDVGIIFRGSSSNGERGITATPWTYGQFEENVLNCVLVLLEKDKRYEKQPMKSLRKQNSAVFISRVCAAMLNCQNDNGLLEGNWSGKYEKGTPPGKWFDSSVVFQEYFKTNQPVKYGQCWVFSGVMTTALRALGIPARCVTNFDSAHDTDESLTIDVYHSEDGKRMDDVCDDSIWNFHVWNELWTKRSDLPSKDYDGWNVVDCTPQEKSCELYQTGPCPVKAIKNGEIYMAYDAGFVFAEVNADYVKWIVSKDPSGNIVYEEASYRHTKFIGKFISTKMVGRDEREDITSSYKHSEGSEEERAAFENAYKFGLGAVRRKGLLNKENDQNDFEIDLVMKDGTMIQNGADFPCTIQIRNISQHTSTVNVIVVVSTIEYTGRVKALVKKETLENITVAAGENVKREILVNAEEYIRKLSDLNCMKIVAIARVLETKKQFIEDCKIQVYHGEAIGIQFLDAVEAGKPTRVEITFTNKLKVNMTSMTYSVYGRGLTRTITQERSILRVGETATNRFRIIPFKAGIHTLIVDVDCAEVKDWKSSLQVEVL